MKTIGRLSKSILFLLTLVLLVSCNKAPRLSPQDADRAARTYGALLMVDGAWTWLDDLATKITTGQDEPGDAWGVFITAGIMLKAVDERESTESDLPFPALQTQWDTTQGIVVELRLLLKGWWDGDMTVQAAQVKLDDIRPRLTSALVGTETVLGRYAGVDTQELAAIRLKAQTSLHESMP